MALIVQAWKRRLRSAGVCRVDRFFRPLAMKSLQQPPHRIRRSSFTNLGYWARGVTGVLSQLSCSWGRQRVFMQEKAGHVGAADR